MSAETSAKALYQSLSEEQRREVCFDWDYREPQRGLLRSFIANHWQVTRPAIRSDFFTREQQHLIHETFTNLVDPSWYPRFILQLRDDTKGSPFGTHQSIALFGDPDRGPFEFIITGRHLTLRADGGAEGRVAFGGPIFYGHQASGFYERPNHPGNVFWPQAEAMGRFADTLDAAQLARAVTARFPSEFQIDFRGEREGLPVSALAPEQRKELDDVLSVLVEPFRASDRARLLEILAGQGGLDACHVMLTTEGRMSAPRWDNWRIEGPSFVWHFQGFPHVHGWIHVAEDAAIRPNVRNGVFIFPNQDALR